MTIGKRLFQGGIAAAASTVTSLALVSLAFAAPHGGTRPGWGCGDTNHVHTGPPGLGAGAVSPCGNHGVTTPPPNAAAVHFVVSAPATASAGSAFNFTVTAEDRDNNVLAAFGDTLHFTST